MDKEKIFDLIAVIVITLVGLLTAYVCFGILQSRADGQINGVTVGGALAGALVASGVMTTAYLQFRKSSDELTQLQSRVGELQSKLLRGAPRPGGFEVEIDERRHMVLARPQEWENRGGYIFNFELPSDKMRADDILPATFNVQFFPITQELGERDQFYQDINQRFYSPLVAGYSNEFVYLGGSSGGADPGSGGIKSLKILAQQYARVETSKNPLTSEAKHDWWYVPKDEFDKWQADQAKTGKTPALDATHKKAGKKSLPKSKPAESSDSPEPLPASAPTVQYVAAWHMQVICWHADLKTVFVFDASDDDKDFAESSSQFNQILDSMRFLT